MRKIILASVSPWRKKILSRAGITFSTEESGYEENMSLDLPPRALARHLALGKAKAAAVRHKNALIIGADTFIVFRGALLGKPHTPARAIAMLKKLSGHTHTILTGYAIMDSKTGRCVTRTIGTRVTFRKLPLSEIREYVRSGEPLKAAGAYVIQGQGARLIEKTEGDVNNIAGLPLEALMKDLRRFKHR
ncbi:septum formation protein Maf [Candidatus Kaiserbacteria bacterium RIFCSPLOWO2_01_FULL_54_24]|uniref:Nucleoside triphosphate pyrophosphatase n=1 Tax=Candidatus Kaiserbacteria bacterium RIFCSPLOWO2_01_FULL_54_24 TaxID=1798515 RepID=A0A1F6EUV6_9BACT|nr:MAG: septum formation protein Maf [Candidatus Kaiserbacteria bacterium RIFCSPLOWO2_01_FULL_54_24]